MLTLRWSLYNRPRLPPAGALLVGSRPPAAERPLLGVFSPVTSPYKPHGAVELVLESLPSVCSSKHGHTERLRHSPSSKKPPKRRADAVHNPRRSASAGRATGAISLSVGCQEEGIAVRTA